MLFEVVGALAEQNLYLSRPPVLGGIARPGRGGTLCSAAQELRLSSIPLSRRPCFGDLAVTSVVCSISRRDLPLYAFDEPVHAAECVGGESFSLLNANLSRIVLDWASERVESAPL